MYNELLEEIKIANHKINAEFGTESYDESISQLIEVIDFMNGVVETARKEGLLSLEDLAYSDIKLPYFDVCKKLIGIVVDGTKPELVKEWALNKFFALDLNNSSAADALTVLIYIECLRNILMGESIFIIEPLMLSMCPAEVEVRRNEALRKKSEELASTKEKDSETVKLALCMNPSPIDENSSEYQHIKEFEGDFMMLDDSATAAVINDLSDEIVTDALSGLCSATKSQILRSLTSERKELLADNLISGRTEDPVKILNAIKAIEDKRQELIDAGKIIISRGTEL